MCSALDQVGIGCSLKKKKIKLTFTEPLIARPYAKLFTSISFNPQDKPIRLVLLFPLELERMKGAFLGRSRLLSWEVEMLGF